MDASNLPDWMRAILTIGECCKKLPADCDRDFTLASIHSLAALIVDTHGVLTDHQQGVLVGIGALVMRQLATEDEARLMAGEVIDRARKGDAA